MPRLSELNYDGVFALEVFSSVYVYRRCGHRMAVVSRDASDNYQTTVNDSLAISVTHAEVIAALPPVQPHRPMEVAHGAHNS